MENSPKIVEIIGTPGIGKTWLYRAVCKTWNPKHNWIYPDALLAPKKPAISNPIKWLEYHYRRYSGKKLSKSIPVDYGLRFIHKNNKIAAFCWKYLTENPFHNSLENRYRSSHFLFLDFSRYQAIKEKKNPKPCLVDEGFFQKSFLIHEDKEMMAEVLEEYLKHLPLPHAVFILESKDKGLILERLKNRKKIIASHLCKNDADLSKDIDNWQILINLIREKLKNKGVLVYNIDGSNSLGDKVSAVNSILKTLEPTGYPHSKHETI